MLTAQKDCLGLVSHPYVKFEHLLDTTEIGGRGDFMYCHSSLASVELMKIRKLNLEIFVEVAPEFLNYAQGTEEQITSSKKLVKKLTPIIKEHQKCIAQVVKDYPKMYGKGVNKTFLEHLEIEINLLEENVSWPDLDANERQQIIARNEYIKEDEKEYKMMFIPSFMKFVKIL